MNQALSAAVAHDVKNRLVILGEQLSKLSAMHLDEAAHSHVAVANEQASLLAGRLVEWLTLQAAADRGGLHATPHEEVPEFFLADLHSEALRMTAGRVHLVREAGELPAFWFFDAQLVRLAIDSALHNALRFAESRITLGAKMAGDRLCFYVRDDGPGVQNAGCATSTGLGSALCSQVALAHRNRGAHGRSELRDHPGGGAIFELHLP
jgi:signal transduction histidine kinase